MPCNPCCEEVPAMASYIAEAESSASCCDFCTIYCCFGLTLFALCLMSLPPFALASIQQKKNHNGLCKIRHSCPTAVLDHTFLVPPIQCSGPGGPCRFSSYRSWGSCMSVSFFLLVWVQCIPHQEWLDCATKKLRAKHQRPPLSTSTPQLLTNETLAGCSAMWSRARSGHLSCSNALATVSRAAPAVFCPWQAATSFPATDPSRQWLSNLQFCISCNLGFPRNTHDRPLHSQSDIESLSPAAQGTAQGTALIYVMQLFPCCEILSLAATFFP